MYKIIFSNGFIVNSGYDDLEDACEDAEYRYYVAFHNDDNWIVRVIQDGIVIWEAPDFDFKSLEGLV